MDQGREERVLSGDSGDGLRALKLLLRFYCLQPPARPKLARGLKTRRRTDADGGYDTNTSQASAAALHVTTVESDIKHAR